MLQGSEAKLASYHTGYILAVRNGKNSGASIMKA
jgi:hypothetical protein